MRTTRAGIIVIAVALAVPAGAQAATFYAEAGGGSAPGCPQADPCTLANAITQADAVAGRDTIQIVGPFTRTSTSALSLDIGSTDDGIDLVGSGQDPATGTVIRGDPAGTGNSVLYIGQHSSARNLRVRIEGNDGGDIGVRIVGGGALRDATVVSDSTDEAGGVAFNPGDDPAAQSVVERVTTGPSLDAAIDDSTGVDVAVSDSKLAAGGLGIGIGSPATVDVERTAIAGGFTGINAGGAALTVSSSVITVSQGGPSTRAIDVFGASTAEVRNSTVLDMGSTQALQGVVNQGTGAVAIHGSIVRGFLADLQQATGTLTVDTSDFHSQLGSVTNGGGNIDADPKLVNPATEDYRLAPASPAIDAAGTAPVAAGESATDLLGSPRLLDGNGDGVAARDMGAFEYRRPVPALSFSPAAPQVGTPVRFDASASSYPEAAIASVALDLDGDGTFETAGSIGTHTYATAGTVPVGVRVTGADGAVAQSTFPVVIAAAPVPKDTTPPILDHVSLSHTTFAVSSKPTALSARKRAPKGTSFRFRLSEAAKVRISIDLVAKGRKVGHRCLSDRRSRRHHARCTLYRHKGTLTRGNLAAGSHSVAFTGRLGRRKLAPGRYRAQLSATDAAGNASRTRTLRFTIVR